MDKYLTVAVNRIIRRQGVLVKTLGKNPGVNWTDRQRKSNISHIHYWTKTIFYLNTTWQLHKCLQLCSLKFLRIQSDQKCPQSGAVKRLQVKWLTGLMHNGDLEKLEAVHNEAKTGENNLNKYSNKQLPLTYKLPKM